MKYHGREIGISPDLLMREYKRNSKGEHSKLLMIYCYLVKDVQYNSDAF